MNKKNGLQILKETREILVDPEKWTCLSFARNKEGNPVTFNDPTAVCWCLEGAMRKVADNAILSDGYITAVIALRENCLNTFNDELYENDDHAGLLDLIDYGITKLSGGRLRLKED